MFSCCDKGLKEKGTKILTHRPTNPDNSVTAPHSAQLGLGMDVRIVALVQLLARRAAEHDFASTLHEKPRAQNPDERSLP